MVNNCQLLEQCRRGDQRAWDTLVERYERLVYSIPLNLGLTAEDAADVAQATFSALLGSIDSITEPDRLNAWLSTLAKRHSIRVMEQRDRDRQRAAAVSAEPIDHAFVDSTVADVEWLNQGMERISPKCRELLTRLYFSDEMDYATTAADLGMALGSVGPTRRRCIESLRQALLALEVIGDD